MRNKIFTKIIITTLLVTFLTFNVGRVTRVSAVGTTAAIAGTAFILTGAVYLSYLALTQGQIMIPAADELHNWLGDIGRKVSQYPSGSSAYQDIYQGLARSPVGNVIDGVWTWTQDRIKSFANDFSDTRLITQLTEYDAVLEIIRPGLPAEYFANYTQINVPYDTIRNDIGWPNGQIYTLQDLAIGYTFTVPSGIRVNKIGYDSATSSYKYYSIPTSATGTYRNYRYYRTTSSGNRYLEYKAQQLVNGNWVDISSIPFNFPIYNRSNGALHGYISPYNINYMRLYTIQDVFNLSSEKIPIFPDLTIYDSITNTEVIPNEIVTTEHQVPSWVDPNNENRPIIPWVPIPNLPPGITPPSGFNIPQWGFPLQDLLDLLESLAEALIEIGAIGELINQFAGLHGDEYYLYYNEGDTNYYTYYQPTIFDNDTEYVTYNINVSEQEDVIPVDLNTISLYTQNRYLEQIKESAIAGSSMLRDLAVFWFDVDPEVTYIMLGCCILVLIGAFTGKLGHS